MYKLTRGERFKDARTALNQHGSQTMNAVQCATGVSASLIADLENDQKDRRVNYVDIAKLAKHYGVTSDWLLGLTEDHDPRPCAADDLGLSPQAIAQILRIKALDDADNVLEGLSMLLAENNIIALADEIKKYSDVIQAETAYIKEALCASDDLTKGGLFPASTMLGVRDLQISNTLEKELISAHPELRGRIAVVCGQSSIDQKLRDIIGIFETAVNKAAGYYEYLSAQLGV